MLNCLNAVELTFAKKTKRLILTKRRNQTVTKEGGTLHCRKTNSEEELLCYSYQVFNLKILSFITSQLPLDKHFFAIYETTVIVCF